MHASSSTSAGPSSIWARAPLAVAVHDARDGDSLDPWADADAVTHAAPAPHRPLSRRRAPTYSSPLSPLGSAPYTTSPSTTTTTTTHTADDPTGPVPAATAAPSARPPPRAASHPLALDELGDGYSGDVGLAVRARELALAEVSRPGLKRVTSETERRVELSQLAQQTQTAESSRSGSERGASLDLSRPAVPREVQVLVHQVGPNESLAGISLQYGADLATLRKANKLWPSDPVHLRTHLYIPLDACSRDAVVRGPGEGQVTVVSRLRRPTSGSVGVTGDGPDSRNSGSGAVDANVFAALANATSSPQDDVDVKVEAEAEAESPRILDIVHLPSSQLRFFPRARRREPPTARASLDSDLGRTADSVRRLSAAETEHRERERGDHVHGGAGARPNVHHTVAFTGSTVDHFVDIGTPRAPDDDSASRKIVRLRPPSSTTLPNSPSSDSLATKLANLFTVPPPPAFPSPVPRQRAPRVSGGPLSSAGGESDTRAPSRRSSGSGATPRQLPVQWPEVVLEMQARTPEAVNESPATSTRVTDKKLD